MITGEGNFDDGGNGTKGSGTATPNVNGEAGGDGKGSAVGGAAKKRKTTGGGSKKAKTTKQRLAIADGEI